MADPRFSQNAARLSEDIGDVLTAIRRMIADDDALSSARDSIRADRTGLVQDDAGEFLARRYGGNAALARQMVETAVRPAPAPAVEEVVETPPVPQFILRARPEVVPPADAAPLRLGAERRVEQPETPKPSGWRSWLRPELREAAPQVEAAPAPAADSFSALVDDSAEDEDDFAEAFDWKARMRPEIEEPKPVALAAGKLSEQRASGWVMSPDHGAVDTVAHLAAEAAAFDAEQRAVADADDEDRAIRELLREMVQEELNGELGQRFSANLRAVIRREIAAAIDAHLDRF
ncbi:hypothetical protein [Paracoccus aerius]|uniref:DUF2497 domain-containing protein n=1 Tax=Paracoccus aerius TaxID=1915382 RepID=A0ABS1SAU1_9RHOB|nr:hypothetical protein [Paracoccus aerius]MBL3674606.1 hypothetical protein [Paracoccus aerius]GHG26928.1 hypothetical protein GCM10017322_26690 [Paracoccus aerius]